MELEKLKKPAGKKEENNYLLTEYKIVFVF